MSVQIACPACEKPLKIAETLLGKELVCPKCEARIVASPTGSAQKTEAAKEKERQEAKDAAAALESELWEDGLRLNHAGGCIRCGSVRLVQTEILSDIGKLLIVIGIVGIVSGLICSFDETENPIGFGGITGGAMMAGVSVWFKRIEHQCQQCGWRWRT